MSEKGFQYIVVLFTYQTHSYFFCKRIIIPSSRICKKELFIIAHLFVACAKIKDFSQKTTFE